MLETVREYMWEQLGNEERVELQRRHAGHFLGVAEWNRIKRNDEKNSASMVQRMEAEHDNLLTALEWFLEHQLERAWDLTMLMRGYWSCRRWGEGRLLLERVLKRSEEAPSRVKSKLLIFGAELANYQGDSRRAYEMAHGSLQLAQEKQDREDLLRVARAFECIGDALWNQGNNELAFPYRQQSLQIFRDLGELNSVAWVLYRLGISTEASGDDGLLGNAFGDDEQARLLYEEAESTFSRCVNEEYGAACAQNKLANLAYWRCDYKGALYLAQKSLAVFQALEAPNAISWLLFRLGEVCYAQASPPASWEPDPLQLSLARGHLQESVKQASDAEEKPGLCRSLMVLGHVERAEGKYLEARSFYAESIALSRELDNLSRRRDLLEALGCLCAAQGQMEQAARLLAAAHARRQSVGFKLHPVRESECDRATAQARESLGAQGFEAAWASGLKMTLQQALDDELAAG